MPRLLHGLILQPVLGGTRVWVLVLHKTTKKKPFCYFSTVANGEVHYIRLITRRTFDFECLSNSAVHKFFRFVKGSNDISVLVFAP